MPRLPPLPHQVPGFEQVILAIIEQDVGLPPIGEVGVRAALADVPFESAFSLTARIDALIRHGAVHQQEQRVQVETVADVFAGHPKHRDLVELVGQQRRRLFSTPYLHAIQRLLVEEAADGREDRPGDRRRMQDAFLGICNVVSPADARPEEFDRDHYLALLTRSAVTNATEPLMEAITRAYAIYYELPRRRDASQMPNYMGRERWEPRATMGLSVHERFMVGMAILGAVGVFNDELPPATRPTGVPPDYFDALARGLQEGADARRMVQAVSADRAGWRTAFKCERPELRNTMLNSIPFQSRPLLRQSNGGYLLSSTDALASWMTRGVHYACLTPLQGTPQAHDFLTYVGRLFEAYAVELLTDAHREQSHVRVIGEQLYDRGSSRTADIAIADDADLVLIEIEARRFSRKALLSPDPQDVVDELETMVIGKARQIGQCIDALRRPHSPAELPGVNVENIQRIWPVIVLEGAIGQTVLLREHLEDRLGDALTKTGVQPLSILSIADLELAASLIEHGNRLAVTLRRWKTGSRKYNDFAFFCSSWESLREHRRSSSVRRRWDTLTAEVNSAIANTPDVQPLPPT
jgi:hypothetical protein